MTARNFPEDDRILNPDRLPNLQLRPHTQIPISLTFGFGCTPKEFSPIRNCVWVCRCRCIDRRVGLGRISFEGLHDLNPHRLPKLKLRPHTQIPQIPEPLASDAHPKILPV
jgi:hypothetical protein